MRSRFLGVVALVTLLLVGCGLSDGSHQGGRGEITENGVYDVSDYSEIVVNVVPDEPIPEPEPEETPAEPEGLELTRVQFEGFSMLVPVTMAPYYTEEVDRTTSIIQFYGPRIDGAESPTLGVGRTPFDMDVTVNEFSEDWMKRVENNGITFSVIDDSTEEAGHREGRHFIEAIFVEDNTLHVVSFTYPVGQEDIYQEYSEQFYYSIELN